MLSVPLPKNKGLESAHLIQAPILALLQEPTSG